MKKAESSNSTRSTESDIIETGSSASSTSTTSSPEESKDEHVKSTAIVKYSIPKPAQFMKLQCNTDLNLPPSNWLSSSGDTYGLQHVMHHPKGFSR